MQKFSFFPAVVALVLVADLVVAGCMQSSPAPEKTSDDRINPPPTEVSTRLQEVIDTGIRNAGIPGVQIEVSTPQWTWNSAAGNASPSPGNRQHPACDS